MVYVKKRTVSFVIDDFEKFVRVINDFKKDGLDAPKIMETYISAISLYDNKKEGWRWNWNTLYTKNVIKQELNIFCRINQINTNNHEYLLLSYIGGVMQQNKIRVLFKIRLLSNIILWMLCIKKQVLCFTISVTNSNRYIK